MICRTPWHASSSGRSRTYCSVEPAPATLAYTGNGCIQLPKVWSANTYRHSLISKVVGVPVREKAAHFFLSLLPYIYIIAIFLEFFKLFLSIGAGRGIRTLTASQPADFKSAMSTIPSLPHIAPLTGLRGVSHFSLYSLEPAWTCICVLYGGNILFPLCNSWSQYCTKSTIYIVFSHII